jgi:hypothetical protein
MYFIEDSRHAEMDRAQYSTFSEALAEIKRRASIPWNQPPNIAPCTSWNTCGRLYEIVEYDVSTTPWKEMSRVPIVDITAEGIEWHIAND